MPVRDYEWDALMRNFNEELKKEPPNWWVWVTTCCRYRGALRPQIQIVLSESVVFKGFNPAPIFAYTQPDWFMCALPIQKEIANQYCTKLMFIAKSIMEGKTVIIK
jgi:hypothetical protein